MACPKYAGLHLYFLFISWWQGKMILKVTQKCGITEGNWVWNVRWTLLPAGFWRSWIIILSVLRAEDGTEFFKLLHLWGCICAAIWKNFSFSKEASSPQAHLPTRASCVFLPWGRAQWAQCPQKWECIWQPIWMYAVSLTDKPILSKSWLSLK